MPNCTGTLSDTGIDNSLKFSCVCINICACLRNRCLLLSTRIALPTKNGGMTQAH